MATYFFHSGMAGAPTNTNAAGSTLEIIRSCLVTGFNLKSVVSASVASGVMTINYAAPHGYEDRVWLRLDGAAGGSIVQRVTTAAGASSLTIPAPGFVDGAVAGTLSTRVAPADWEEVFTDTGIGVFRSKVEGPGSTRFFYRVADQIMSSNARMLRGFESMTDADTGTEPFPTLAQQTTRGSPVRRADQTTPLPWVLVADGRSVYFFAAHYTYPNLFGHFFGDLSPISGTDNYFAGVFAWNASVGYVLAGDNGNIYAPRNAAGAPGAVEQGMVLGLGNFSGVRAFPSPVDGGLILQRPVLMMDGTTSSSPIRGYMRGLMHVGGIPVPSGDSWTILNDVVGVPGRVLAVLDGGNSRAVAFPLDEDWA
jgi:hypothetical protein